jgi:hypothetical protein
MVVVVDLSDDLEGGSVACLSSIVLGALADADVPVTRAEAWKGTPTFEQAEYLIAVRDAQKHGAS